jgi:Zn finger protein HypA/HybF involved in hydrogenase expression
MHELSIALSMIEQIEEEAEKHGGGIVEVVYVRIGETLRRRFASSSIRLRNGF